jgi:serine/threonine protein kinase
MADSTPSKFVGGFGEAFQRHPRPQGFKAPTKAALLERSLKKHPPSTRTTEPPSVGLSVSEPRENVEVQHRTPWKDLRKLGDLTQGSQRWTICAADASRMMVKKFDSASGKDQISKLQLLHHTNISSLQKAFLHESQVFLGFEFAPITLEEVLHVHLRLEEPQIRIIATSVCVHIQLETDEF